MEEIKTKSIRDAQTNTTIADSHLLNFFGSATGFFKITWANIKTLLGSSFAPLTGGKIPATYLPSYVDEILEYANVAAFPATGETDKIYIALDEPTKCYRWGGTVYAVVGGDLELGNLITNAYYGDKGKIAYDFSQGTQVTALVDLDTHFQGFFYVNSLDIVFSGTIYIVGGWSTATTPTNPTYATQTLLTTSGLYTRYYDEEWSAWDKTDKSATITKSSLGLGNVDNTSDALKPVSTATAAAIAVVQSEVDAVEVRVDALEIYPIRLYATTTNATSVEFLDINGDRLPLQSYPYMIELRAIRTGDDLGLMSGGVFTAWGASDSDYYEAHTGGGGIPMSLSDSEAQGIWADLTTVQPKLYAKGATATDLSWVIEVTYITTTPVS
jgi:hypothetical protein